jgi:hypothetical protein
MAGLLSGILGGPKLKKTNGPQKAAVVEEEQDPKKKAAMGMAEAAAAMRAAMGSVNVNAKLAAAKAAKTSGPTALQGALAGLKKATTTVKGSAANMFLQQKAAESAYKSGINALKAEGARRNASVSSPPSPKPSSSNSSPVPGTVVGNLQYSNADIDGSALPAGIRRVSDAQDTWYEVTGTQLSNWTLANLQAKRPKSRKGGRRANRKGSRKNRGNNFRA